jgi:sulfur carrier protein ThiS
MKRKLMKSNSRNLFILVCIILSNFVSAQNSVENLLRGYKNDEGVFAMKYQGEKLNKVIQSGKESKTNKIRTTLDFIDIIVLKNGKDLTVSDQTKLASLLTKEKFETLVEAKSKEGKVKLSAKMNGDAVTRICARLLSPRYGNCYVIMSGNIFLEDLATISKSLNIQELDFMKDLKM